VIDVSDPDNPQRVGGYDTSGSARDVAVSGNYAYVADHDAGLQVIEVSDPANPQRLGGYDTGGSARDVAVSGNYAYVADGGGGLQMIDVSDPANPQRTGGYATSGDARDVAVSGNYAYVADGPWGLTILGPRPRITAITRTAGTATVYYTNTIPGMNYTLECSTNLTKGNWQLVGTQPAPGDNASQTDNAATSDHRFYRVFYQP